jgi:hypothetical protein
MLFSYCSERLHHPARHPADGEDRHEQVHRDAVQLVDHAGVEIHVHVDAVARVGLHRLDQGLQDGVPLRLAHLRDSR